MPFGRSYLFLIAIRHAYSLCRLMRKSSRISRSCRRAIKTPSNQGMRVGLRFVWSNPRERRLLNSPRRTSIYHRDYKKKRAAVSHRRAPQSQLTTHNPQIDNNFLASCAVATGLPYSAHKAATRLTNCALLFASVSLSHRTLSSSPVRQCPPSCNVQWFTSS